MKLPIWFHGWWGRRDRAAQRAAREAMARHAEALGKVYASAREELRKVVRASGSTRAQRTRAAELIRAANQEIRLLKSKAVREAWEGLVRESYGYGVGSSYAIAVERAGGELLVPDLGSAINRRTVSTLVDGPVDDMWKAVDGAGRLVTRVVRASSQKALADVELSRLIGASVVQGQSVEGMAQSIADALRSKLEDGKVVPVLCKDGRTRHYDLERYAAMVARTRSREAQSIGAVQEAVALDMDLMQIDVHDQPCPFCALHQGKVYSISGKSPDFPPLTVSLPFHPNCECNWAPVSPESLYADGWYEALSAYSKDPSAGVDTWDEYVTRMRREQRTVRRKRR